MRLWRAEIKISIDYNLIFPKQIPRVVQFFFLQKKTNLRFNNFHYDNKNIVQNALNLTY